MKTNKRKTPSEERGKDRIFFIWLFALIGQTTCHTSPRFTRIVYSFCFTVSACWSVIFVGKHSTFKIPTIRVGKVFGVCIGNNCFLVITRNNYQFTAVEFRKNSYNHVDGQVRHTDNFITAHFYTSLGHTPCRAGLKQKGNQILEPNLYYNKFT